MKSSEMYLLIVKDFRRQLNENEQQLLSNWRGESAENEQCYRQLLQILQEASSEAPPATPDIRVEWEKLRRELGLGSQPNQTYLQHTTRQQTGGFRWIYAAVASLAIAVAAIWLLRGPAGVSLSTANAEIRTTTLPDGSQITLNSGSAARYYIDSKSGDRLVELQGEAYFQVAANPNNSFRVITGEARIHVVGTAFNVRSREGKTALTVVEGSVEFSGRQQAEEQYLSVTAGFASVCYLNDAPEPVQRTPVDLTGAWRQRNLHFDRTPLLEIVAELQRFYDIQVDVRDGVKLDETFSGTFRQQTVEEVISAICSAANLEYTISGKNATIFRKE